MGAHLLLIENDQRLGELISWFLTKRGFQVRRAVSFREARGLLAERVPDLMLSDVDLGGESARDELPRLAAEGLLPPTLVVSGYLDPDTWAELEALEGVVGLLPKPFELKDLVARVESLVGVSPTGVADGAASPAAPAAPGAEAAP
jgi:DNA-binding response OmpR family regulator